MDKITKARNILKAIGMPTQQQSELCALILLALAGIKKSSAWNCATNEWVRVHDIIQYVNQYYGKKYAENSRETFRKQALHHFRTAAIAEDNGLATNSPNYSWRLTAEFLQVVRAGGIVKAVNLFCNNHESLVAIYSSKKRIHPEMDVLLGAFINYIFIYSLSASAHRSPSTAAETMPPA